MSGKKIEDKDLNKIQGGKDFYEKITDIPITVSGEKYGGIDLVPKDQFNPKIDVDPDSHPFTAINHN